MPESVHIEARVMYAPGPSVAEAHARLRDRLRRATEWALAKPNTPGVRRHLRRSVRGVLAKDLDVVTWSLAAGGAEGAEEETP